MGTCSMIQCEKYPRVFFRNEKTRFWAENTIKEEVSATEHVAGRADVDGINYLIIHPEDNPDDVPFDYNGNVIRFDTKSVSTQTKSIAN